MGPSPAHRRGDELRTAGSAAEAIEAYLEAMRGYRATGEILKRIAVAKMVAALDADAVRLRASDMAEYRIEEFSRIPLFADLPMEALAELVEVAPLLPFRLGQILVAEGSPGTSMYVLVQGSVTVSVAGRPVAAMDEGALFGEMAIVSDAPRLASVTGAEDGLVLELERRELDRLGREFPGVGAVVEGFYRDRLLANLMRANALFRALPEAEQDEVMAKFVSRSVTGGTEICHEGGFADGIYVILRGSCEVSWHAGGKVVEGPPMREGDVFGEISVLSEGRATATVRAAGPCVLLFMGVDDAREMLLGHEEVRYNLNRLGHERLGRTAASQQAAAQGSDEPLLDDYLL